MTFKVVPAILLFATAITVFGQDAGNTTSVLDQKPSDSLNDQLPSWLRMSGEFRFRFEEFTPRSYRNGEDSYLLLRTRFNVAIHPTNWLVIFGQAQDARSFYQNFPDPAPPFNDTWDLRQAYVRFGHTEEGPISFTVGRQEINLGDERLVGSSNWTNDGRTFDAARLRLKRGGYRLDAFAASVVDLRTGAFDHHTPGNNLHGIIGGFDRLIPAGTIEPYLLWRVAPARLSPVLESGGRGKLDLKTLGFRSKGKWPGGFDYNVEMAKQFGDLGGEEISAWAGHWVAGKTFSSSKGKPRIFLEYNFASGDENPSDRVRGTFDQMYPTAHGKYGYSDQVGWRNIHDAHIGVMFKPHRRIAVETGFHEYWLANPRDGLYSSNNALVVRSMDGSAGRYVGSDLDVLGTYSISGSLKFGVGCGHLFTGRFLNRTTAGQDFTYPYVVLTWAL